MRKGYIIEKYNCMGHAYTCRRLAEEAGRLGMEVTILGVQDTILQGTAVINAGRTPQSVDFVLQRYKWGYLKESLCGLGKRVYNASPAFDIYVNKYEQRKRLRSEAFRIPRYLLLPGGGDADMAGDILGFPFVAKGLESSMGREIFLIRSGQDFAALRERFGQEKEWLAEEFIRESAGTDMRLYAVRGEVLCAMIRTAAGDFRANVALGAGVRACGVTPFMRQAARDIYRQTGLDFLGIDLLFGKDRPVLCEINVMPGLEGMEKASGINVAGKVMETIAGDFAGS